MCTSITERCCSHVHCHRQKDVERLTAALHKELYRPTRSPSPSTLLRPRDPSPALPSQIYPNDPLIRCQKSLERYSRAAYRWSQQLLGDRGVSWDSSCPVRPKSATRSAPVFVVGRVLPSRQRLVPDLASRLYATSRKCPPQSGLYSRAKVRFVSKGQIKQNGMPALIVSFPLDLWHCSQSSKSRYFLPPVLAPVDYTRLDAQKCIGVDMYFRCYETRNI